MVARISPILFAWLENNSDFVSFILDWLFSCESMFMNHFAKKSIINSINFHNI